MKIRVGDLKPNPYRMIKTYPISEEKVERLRQSMEETGFWDNILAREANGRYEIAYGHHRLEAVKRLNGRNFTVDIPVKELDDATMIRIMANENVQQNEAPFIVVIETVKVAKDYLEKVENRGKDTPGAAGPTAISKFLGGGWVLSKVEVALRALRMLATETLDYEASKMLPSIASGRHLMEGIEKAAAVSNGKKVHKPVQRAIAKGALEGNAGKQYIIRQCVDSVYEGKDLEEETPEINDFMNQEFVAKLKWLNVRLGLINEHKEKLEPETFQGIKPRVVLLIKQLNELFTKGSKNEQAKRPAKLLRKS